MAVPFTQALNLTINASKSFETATEQDLVVRVGDLTQLGFERGRLPAALQLPSSKAIQIVFPKSATNKFWKQFFEPNTAMAEGHDVRFIVDTTPLSNTLLADNVGDHAKVIGALKESLDPAVLVSHDEVMASDRMRQVLETLRRKQANAQAAIASLLTEAAPMNKRLESFLVNSGLVEVDNKTALDEFVVEPFSIEKMDYGQMLTLRSILGGLTNEMDQAFVIVEFFKNFNVMKYDESVGNHPLLSDHYSTARAELMSRNFVPPAPVKALFDQVSSGSLIKLVSSFGNDNTWTPMTLKDGVGSVLGEFAIYCISLCQIVPQSPERAREFAMTRLLVVRHGLFVDSDEVTKVTLNESLTVTMAEVDEFKKLYRAPEVFYACLYVSAISFLKSGHHATAANLDNTLMKILGSLGIQTSLDSCRSLIPCGVYNGPHVASMRMLYAYLLYKNATEKVTNSVAYRLHPNPPGAAAYCNLEIFIDSLNMARFFDILDRQQDYVNFKSYMREIRRSMHYVAPYSFYLYGKTAPDPLALKAEAGKMAAYATALKTVLPGTTLAMSPALAKLADQQGKNDISANLLVTAYVTGFTRYFKHTIEASMAKKYGVSRGTITL
jgi:hypothetical protein